MDRAITMPPEETLDLLGVVTPSDEVIHAHPSSRASSTTGHHDHKPKRRKQNVNDALPQDFNTPPQSKINAQGGVTEPVEGGAHRSHRPTPAVAKSTEAGGPSSRDSSVASPASSSFIRFKHPSSLLIGGGSEQHPAAGSSSGRSGHSSYHANNHAAAASSSFSRLIREPGIVPRESDDVDAECFLQGVAAFGSLDVAAQVAEVKKFTGVGQQPQPLPEGGGFTFWLTPEQADADLAWVYGKVNARKEPASGSWKRR